MTEEEYRELPGVRWTHLRAMSISPAHYQASLLEGGDEDTRSMRLGRAIDCALLEPDRFRTEWIGYAGERRGNKWTAFAAEHATQEILNAAESAFVVNCVASIKRHKLATALLSGARQQAITWVDDATGLRCKARPDVIWGGARGGITDLKSARDVTPKAFGWSAGRLGYHGQMAMYFDGARAAGFEMRDQPIIVAVETKRPWDVVCYEVGQAVLDAGRALYQRLLLRVLECEAKHGPARMPDPRESTRWPGRSPDNLVQLQLPDSILEEAAGPLDFGDGVEVSW